MKIEDEIEKARIHMYEIEKDLFRSGKEIEEVVNDLSYVESCEKWKALRVKAYGKPTHFVPDEAFRRRYNEQIKRRDKIRKEPESYVLNLYDINNDKNLGDFTPSQMIELLHVKKRHLTVALINAHYDGTDMVLGYRFKLVSGKMPCKNLPMFRYDVYDKNRKLIIADVSSKVAAELTGVKPSTCRCKGASTFEKAGLISKKYYLLKYR